MRDHRLNLEAARCSFVVPRALLYNVVVLPTRYGAQWKSSCSERSALAAAAMTRHAMVRVAIEYSPSVLATTEKLALPSLARVRVRVRVRARARARVLGIGFGLGFGFGFGLGFGFGFGFGFG